MRTLNQIRITAYSLKAPDGNSPPKAVTHLRAEIIRRPEEKIVIAAAPPEEETAEQVTPEVDVPWSYAGV